MTQNFSCTPVFVVFLLVFPTGAAVDESTIATSNEKTSLYNRNSGNTAGPDETYGQTNDTNVELEARPPDELGTNLTTKDGFNGTFSPPDQSLDLMITNPSPSLPDGNPLLLTAEQFSLALLVMEKLRYVILPLALLVTFVNVTVFADRAMRGATSTYILALSLAQILYLVIEVLYQILQKEMQNPFNSAFFIGYMIYVKTYLAMLVLRRTAYVVACLVSTERLYAILRPLHVKTFCLVRYPKSFLAGAYLLGLVYHLYYPVRLKVVYRGEGVYGVQWTEGYLKNRALVDSVGVSTKIVMTFLPLSVQIVLNVLTITGLRRHTAIRKSMTSAGSSNLPAGDAAVIKSREAEMKRERQMTVTILVVTICYVVLAMPIYVHSLLISLAVPGYNNLFGAKYSRLFSVVQVVSHNCTYLSCFTDFFGFVLLSSAYRKVFVRRFRLTSLVKRFTGGQGKDLGGSELTDTTADR